MEERLTPKNFIEEFIQQDIQEKGLSHIQTRFPPEPNGYLHIGHAKALFIDFSMAEKFGGSCNLRFDDTNPTKEDEEFVDAIQEDIRWMGFHWDHVFFGSDYFDTCYELAVKLIKKGVAYVCDLSKDEMREYRGTLTEPGRNSPWRDRSVEENLDLFERMKNGEFPDGSRTLRAKIDMASPNMNMRDPAMYRIIHMRHHHTGDKWCIYPMYDFAHPIQDAIEGVTHSLCSLEYEDHRPLYDWVVEQCEFEHKPRQIEFARLNLTNTMMSKRYLRRLVEEGHVAGWDDPRMPTLCGLRRRGYTAESIRDFLTRVGVAKADSVVETAMLEHCVREDLNAHAHRMIAVLDPIRLVVENWPEGKTEAVAMENLPSDPAAGSRTLTFSRELYIQREDFSYDPPKKYFRLKPDGEVRLKGAYIVKCTRYETDEAGNVTTVYCTYDPESHSGEGQRKVKGTLHWLSKEDAVPAEFRLYEDLLLPETPENAQLDFTQRLNPDSMVKKQGFVEPTLAACAPGCRYQFMRVGYFCSDLDHTPAAPVFNRIVGLKDSFKMN
ncbi:MAG TPA: glutamine--tRNA ligase/YqeY domain fusion protein [Candidatus Pelethousia gallinarum]|nr:glutamine--tRNA ligase/YqeY domain fusion protein [Candidatus Pelethousia gallinarum]